MSEKPNSEDCEAPLWVMCWFFFFEFLQLCILIGLVMFGSNHG